jgi:hypothetical protein
MINDSTILHPDTLVKRVLADTLIRKEAKARKIKLPVDSVKPFKPDPVKVIWMGAIIPGYGQILNRSYWKLPIVYGGFLGCAYAITWNSSHYQTYRLAYKDLLDYKSDPDNKTNPRSYLSLLPDGKTEADYPNLTTNLKSAYEQFRRYRDLSVIVTVGYYAIVLVEAYVDAQLFDFDISSDLSMHWSPALFRRESAFSASPGFQVSLRLK